MLRIYVFSLTRKPWMSGTAFIVRINGSSVRMNSMGERGHPCRVSFCILTVSDNVPLILICAVRWWYKLLIQANMWGFSPMWVQVVKKNPTTHGQRPSPHQWKVACLQIYLFVIYG